MTVKEISNLCDITEVMRVDRVTRCVDYLGNKLADSLDLDYGIEDTSFESNKNKDVFRLIGNYDGEIVALYIDGKTVFSSSTHIIAEEKTTQNLDISNYGSVFDTRLFCNQRYIDYVVIIRVSIRKRGDEEKALNEFYEYTHKIASRFNGTVKFVMRLSNSVKDRYIETHLDKSWKKEAVKICDKEDEVFTKVFVS